jgi:hypothetical protein
MMHGKHAEGGCSGIILVQCYSAFSFRVCGKSRKPVMITVICNAAGVNERCATNIIREWLNIPVIAPTPCVDVQNKE